MKRTYRFCTIIFSVIFVSQIFAHVPVINYSPSEYDAGIQNWSVAVQDNGWLYVANNYGLLEFDGNNWQLYGVSFGSALRSVSIAPDKSVFVGATNEFGRFYSNSIGGLTYKSLSDSLPHDYESFGEIWNIAFLHDNVYFQGNNAIFIFDTNADSLVSVISRDEHIFCSAMVNGGIYVATASGVYALMGSSMNMLRGSDLLHGYEVRCMSALSPSSFLIATDLGGVFIYNGQQIIPYKTGIDSFLRKNQIYTMAINEKYIALGTVLSGVAYIDRESLNVIYAGRSEGLQNNTILSMAFDAQGYMWVGLDQGLAHVFVDYPIVNIFENELFIGAGYSAINVSGHDYYGTNQGVYIDSHGTISMIDGSQGQVWSLDTVGNRLLCCHHRGLFEVDKDVLMPINLETGFWGLRILNDGSAVLGSYNGLYSLSIENNRYEINKIVGLDETGYNYEIDEHNNVWFNGLGGVYRIIIENGVAVIDTVLHKSDFEGTVYIIKYEGRVYLTNQNACWLVDDDNELQDATDYFKRFVGNGLYYKIIRDVDGNEWFMTPNELHTRRLGEDISDLIISNHHFFIDGFYFLKETESRKLIIGGVDGFYSINRSLLRLSDAVIPENVYIREMLTTNRGDSIVYGESYPIIAKDIILSYADNSVRFRYGGNVAVQCEYSVCLDPIEDEYSLWSTFNIKEYTSLYEGRYEFKVRMRAVGSSRWVESSVKFRVLPPWYRRWYAILIYMLIGGVLIYFIYRYYNDRIILQYKQEAFEQEKRILELEKERASYDLRHKSQEMSNLLLSQVSKQEILQDIQSDVYKISDALAAGDIATTKKRLKSLSEKLSKQSSNDIDWSKFEENFDIVNDKFLEKLTARFPTLNKNERKLCVYIRLGLYTKEIAPLLNMSTRGVEMLRYRMRRKMDLEREDNLEQMLLKI